MYKLKKALYGLKQAPRAWYERLRDFLLSKGFIMGKVDTTLFTKKIGNDLFMLQIYVDDVGPIRFAEKPWLKVLFADLL